MRTNEDYFIGLDVGTDSVGWAVTDLQYNILKANQKALWGIRLFDKALTAAERRGYRANRRRLERRKQRLEWLQQLFDAEISKVDPAFFLRLQESKFCEEDKTKGTMLGKFTLFSDDGFTDIDYYKRFPTIYHLRKALLTEESSFDIRLVYLAVHHIIKHRGHFLFDVNVSGETLTFETVFTTLTRHLLDEYEIELDLRDVKAFKAHIKDRSLDITKKKKVLKEDAGVLKSQPMQNAIIEMLAGGTVRLANLFQDDALKDAQVKSLSLQDDFNEKEASLEAVLGDRIELIRHTKAVYDWAVLDDILNGQKYISCAKVMSYDKHKKDLAQLKSVVKCSIPDAYQEIFHKCSDKRDNYPAYSGRTKCNYRCDYDAFAKYLKKELSKSKDMNCELGDIITELENGIFLPKQMEKSNSVIPIQIHKRELVDILDRASSYLPFLIEKDECGMTVKDKILSVFEFRVPYYVGPLNPNSQYAWVKRSGEKVYPWNFRNVVNLDSSAERFIERMTSKCTYIGKPVLPKDSLLYSEFMVHNELNNLRINGNRILPELKNAILRDIFMKYKKVTYKKLVSYLKSVDAYRDGDTISGIDGDFKASLQSHIVFHQILEQTGRNEMVEDIIHHIAVFGDDRGMLIRWLKKTYGDTLAQQDINYVAKLKFSGWGKLSHEFLTEIYHVDKKTGEAISIIDMLRKTNNNLMELLGSKFLFKQAIEAYKQKHGSMTVSSVKQYVEDSYASPAIKRAIFQCVALVDEIVKIMGKNPPKRIFVEMARGEEQKKRTVSRKNVLIDLYKRCKEDSSSLFEQLETKSDGDLRRDKLYLYYTQLGRCMYSGRVIDISRLDSDYDIDHIYPQSRIKDDSIENRVLVEKTLNHKKGNTYPIAQNIREEQAAFWHMLREKGLIGKSKYDRLTRGTPFTEDELAGFIARQLVETRQSSKIIADILKKRYDTGVDVVYVKAGNVSQFRQQADVSDKGEKTFDFVKCREVNDFHHAKDAYLNIVVGNVYHVKFTQDPRRFLSSEAGKNYSMNKVFDYPVVRGGEVAWTPGKSGSLSVVRKNIRKNNILFTRLSTEVGGGLFDQTIMPHKKGQVPIKGSDPRMSVDKFGGYNKRTGSFFCLVEHISRKKRVRSIETVYLMHKTFYDNNPELYCTQVLGLCEPKILLHRIKVNALVSHDGFHMHISGRTGDRLICKNANQLILAPEWHFYIKQASKYVERCKKAGGRELPVTAFDAINLKMNSELFNVLCKKLETTIYAKKYSDVAEKVSSCKECFLDKSLYEQCIVLLEMIRLFSNSNTSGANLTLIGLGKVTGRLNISKNLSTSAEQKQVLVFQSITGVFQQEVDLCSDNMVTYAMRN